MNATVRKTLNFLRRLVVAAIPILLFFALWEYGVRFLPKGVIAPPSRIFKAMFAEFIRTVPAPNTANLTILGHMAKSLNRVLRGYALALVCGLTLGFLLGTYFRPLERLMLPFFRVCEKLNPFAIIPVFMIIFGIYDKEKVAIVFWAAFWPVLFNTQEGAKNVDSQLVRAARSMGASKFKLFTGVIVPYTLPSIFTGLRLATRVAFFMIIASEVIGATSGLGWYYAQQGATHNLELRYGTILFITLLAIIFNAVFGGLEKRSLRWKEALLV
ncbi:MAG: ABC transporter permease [Oscillospiraceae bacterium]|nr:ABC transporter permease [Oscillospiraceae bacterium]